MAVSPPLSWAREASLTLVLAVLSFLPPYRELSREPHLASSPQDEALVQLLLQRWRDPESGLDSAEASTYEVLLSFPSREQPNRVAVGELLLRMGMHVGGAAARPSPDTAPPPQ